MTSLRLSDRAGRGVLLATVLASGMAFLDSTIVNVALPRIGHDLTASLADLQWTINAYTLTLAALVLIGGVLGDRYGRRKVFLIGVVWFTLSSMLCGIAPSVPLLIAGRALQGIGAALLTPGSLSLIQSSFVPEERAKAIGAWAGLGGVAGAIGPFIGGYLVDTWSWRFAFYLNVPLAALVIFATLRWVPESRADEVEPGAGGRFDVGGALLGAIGLGGVTYALVEAPGQAGTVAVWAAAVMGVAALAGFVWVEHRERHPMLPPQVFASAQFSAINVVTLFVYAGLSGVFFFLVLQLQVVARFSALQAGVSLLPMTVVMLAFSSLSGSLAQKIGPRIPLVAGPLMGAAAVLLMLRIGPGASYVWDVLPAVTLMGLGMTTVVPPLTSTVLAVVADRYSGVASGVNNAVSRAGGLLAVAALPLVVGLSGASYQNAGALNGGFRTAMMVCAALFALGAVIALVFVRGKAATPPPERHRCSVLTPMEPGVRTQH
ncbi:MFS transporter [Fodinicola feengrottensis]|uniref:MFS transporter n=1 Tax=Fodinicola feengrottensis TaxID=435914 RepID=A0ABP4TV00_9ACTN